MHENESKSYVGIDVSKFYLDIFINPTGQTMRVSNDKMGIQGLIDILFKQPNNFNCFRSQWRL